MLFREYNGTLSIQTALPDVKFVHSVLVIFGIVVHFPFWNQSCIMLVDKRGNPRLFIQLANDLDR